MWPRTYHSSLYITQVSFFFLFCLSSLLCECKLFFVCSFYSFSLFLSFVLKLFTIQRKHTPVFLFFLSQTHTLAYYTLTKNSFFIISLFRWCQTSFFLTCMGNFFLSFFFFFFCFCIIYIFRFSVEDLFMKRIYLHTYLYKDLLFSFFFFFVVIYLLGTNENIYIYT